MLATREDIDYRVIYMAERNFKQRLEDVYIAKQTHQRPPIFHALLEELVDIEAALFVMHHPEAFSDFTEEGQEMLILEVEAGNEEMQALVFERMDRRFVEMFAKDLYLMLVSHQYAFFEQDVYDSNYKRFHNACIQSVW